MHKALLNEQPITKQIVLSSVLRIQHTGKSDPCHFHPSLLPPCAGKQLLHRPFNYSMSVAHSCLIFQAFMSLLTVSCHLNLDLPLGRFPSIFILANALTFSVSCLLFTCQNHSDDRYIGSTFASFNISSLFPMLIPIAHRITPLCYCQSLFIFVGSKCQK